MSLLKARLNGKIVYANQGEELRGKELLCPECGANLKIRHFPDRPEYYFSLKDGETHKMPKCLKYSRLNTNAPALLNTSPEIFFSILSSEPLKRGNGGNNGGGGTGIHGEQIHTNPLKAKTLEHLIDSGMLNEGPFEITFFNEKYRNIDYFVPGKWAKYIWHNGCIVEIGSRAIEAKWFGTIQDVEPDLKNEIQRISDATYQMWFSRSIKQGQQRFYVRFCLDCEDTYLQVKRKFFCKEYNDKGGYDDFIIKKIKGKNNQMIVLIGAKWVIEEKCKQKCPFAYKMCEGCKGAYWGKCTNINQIILMPNNEKEIINGRYD